MSIKKILKKYNKTVCPKIWIYIYALTTKEHDLPKKIKKKSEEHELLHSWETSRQALYIKKINVTGQSIFSLIKYTPNPYIYLFFFIQKFQINFVLKSSLITIIYHGLYIILYYKSGLELQYMCICILYTHTL